MTSKQVRGKFYFIPNSISGNGRAAHNRNTETFLFIFLDSPAFCISSHRIPEIVPGQCVESG